MNEVPRPSVSNLPVTFARAVRAVCPVCCEDCTTGDEGLGRENLPVSWRVSANVVASFRQCAGATGNFPPKGDQPGKFPPDLARTYHDLAGFRHTGTVPPRRTGKTNGSARGD